MPLDLYNNSNPLGPQDHPKPFASSGQNNHYVEFAGGDEQIIHAQDANAMTIQTDGAFDIEVFVSNYHFERPDYDYDPAGAGNFELVTTATPGGIGRVLEHIVPNPEIVWTSIGSMTAAFETLNIASVQLVKLVVGSAQKVHITTTKRVPTGTGFQPNTATPQPLPKVDTQPTLVEDRDTETYFWQVGQWDDTGAFLGFTFLDMSGAAATPADPVPVNPEDYEVVHTCREAVVAGPGYSVGDEIRIVIALRLGTTAVIGSMAINMETGSQVTIANATDVKKCKAGGGTSVVESCFYYTGDAGGTAYLPGTKLKRKQMLQDDNAGGFSSVITQWFDWFGDPLVTAPAKGDLMPCSNRREVFYEEVIVDHTVPTGLTPPTGYEISHVEIQIKPSKDYMRRAWGDTTSDPTPMPVTDAQAVIRDSIRYTKLAGQIPTTVAVGAVPEDFGHEAGTWSEIYLTNKEQWDNFKAIYRRLPSDAPAAHRDNLRLAVHYFIGKIYTP